MGASSYTTIFYFLIICYSQLLIILLILSQISDQLPIINYDDHHVSHHLHFVKNVVVRSHDHHQNYPVEQLDYFSEWLEWNANDYQLQKKTTSTQLNNIIFDNNNNNNNAVPASSSSSFTKLKSGNKIKKIDHQLAKAEANKVYINVSKKAIIDDDPCGTSSGLCYPTIREALQSIEGNNTRRVIIRIAPGIYREKIVIPKRLKFISLVGSSDDGGVMITGNDTAASVGENGIPMKTFHSATVAVNGDYFVAINIKFENTAPYPEVGVIGGQAVALRISGNKAAFYNCSFYGTQDTLYDHKGLHYFKNCFIQGSVDFIFGYGRSLYQGCTLNSIAKNVSALTAQKRNNNSLTSGFSFINSSIAGSGLVYLGRAWGDHSRVVFSYTYMDNVVIPEGWNDWGDPQRESSVYYGEYKCEGPGANMTGRVHWARVLTDEEAIPFLGTYYVDGDKWLLSSPI